uniref:Histone-lysine N-methyltransferase ATX3 n=1 Tax=Rhizophora mucronata TaxID=61149 RepID=A0A2P2LUG2_RHIMU
MPILKQCKVESPCSEDEEEFEYQFIPKKQKTNGYNPNSIGKCTRIENFSSRSGSWCSEGSCWAADVQSQSKRLKKQGPKESRSSLLRSSRGHSQMLSWKYGDSVPSKWNKDECGIDDTDTSSEDDEFVRGREDFDSGIFASNKIGYTNDSRGPRSSSYFGYRGCDTNYLSLCGLGSGGYVPNSRYMGLEKLRRERAGKRKDIYRPEDFALGDIVWVKCGKTYPWWPAIVIDPILQAPEAVLRCCVPGALCVMFYGYSKNGTQRDYAWAKQGMIFPFAEFMDRFQGQTQLYRCKMSDFQMAIEEAVLAESGFLDANSGSAQLDLPEAHSRRFHEVGGSSQDGDSCTLPQDSWYKGMRCCDSCDLIFPCKIMRKKKGSIVETEFLCEHCSKLRKSKQYCGICKKIWRHPHGGNWVCCDGCNVWVHAECDKIPSKLFKDLVHIDYYCPDCKIKFQLSNLERRRPLIKSTVNAGQATQPGKVTVVCNGMEGTYFPELHLIACNCGSCGSRKQTPSEWERHTGCRAKKWKYSVKVKGTLLPLEKWIGEYNAHGVDPLKLDKHKILAFLQEKYEPVYAKWTTERCAICRWVEDWDYNKIVICNRCQIAVHQECYGARNVKDFTSWVCRACETPGIERECCLCPVKGGALKPSDVEPLWVHVTCAWFRPEVGFLNHETMEPATGILRIPSTSFLKSCVICKQTHGSCAQCCKCATYFHAMCAARAGYFMELLCMEKNGNQVTKKLIYCAVHRKPNPDYAMVMHTPWGSFAARSLLDNQNVGFRGSRLISSKEIVPEPLKVESSEFEPLSSARCRAFKRSNNKVICLEFPHLCSLFAYSLPQFFFSFLQILCDFVWNLGRE